MDAHAETRPLKPRRPLKPTFFVAVVLEVGIVSALVYHRAVFGLVLALAYSWFSASWQLVAMAFRSDDEMS